MDGLTINATVFRNVLLAGRLTSDGQCTGETYSSHIGTWDNVVVQSLVTVTFRDGTALMNIDTGKIKLNSGVVCDASAHACMDIEHG